MHTDGVRINAWVTSLSHLHHQCIHSSRLQIKSVSGSGSTITAVVGFSVPPHRDLHQVVIFSLVLSVGFHWMVLDVPRCACLDDRTQIPPILTAVQHI